jgi:hypothetical protein
MVLRQNVGAELFLPRQKLNRMSPKIQRKNGFDLKKEELWQHSIYHHPTEKEDLHQQSLLEWISTIRLKMWKVKGLPGALI